MNEWNEMNNTMAGLSLPLRKERFPKEPIMWLSGHTFWWDWLLPISWP